MDGGNPVSAGSADSTGMDARRLRDAFGAFITGVTVVTAMGDDAQPVGFTANSFTSVSLAPPLLLVCPSRHLSSFAVFNRCSHFAVNILAEDQREVANRFALPAPRHGSRFENTPWHPCAQCGSPLLEGAAARFSCRARERFDGGDHIILLGEVVSFAAAHTPALGYANGGYFGQTLERRADELTHEARALTVGVILEHNGKVLLCHGENGHTLPQVRVARHTGSLAALQSYLAAAGIRADIGAVYAVVEDARSGADSVHSVYYRGDAHDGDARGIGGYHPVPALADAAAPPLKTMLRRYALEHQSGNFGFYIGDSDTGDIHHPTPSRHPARKESKETPR